MDPVKSQMATENKARRHAILVGINSHDSESGPGLKGCVCDVEEITKQLEQSSAHHVSIHRLTATLRPDSSQPVEPKGQWPTYDNICSCLSKVTEACRHGDFVYIHFSGHSTVVPPIHSYSNWDTGDLALVVLDGEDGANGEERYLHGSEVAGHLRNMVDKGIGVTMVLDCCYSGSTLRGEDVVRYIPYRPEIDRKYLPKAEKENPQQLLYQSASRASRKTSLVPTWLAEPEGYTILTASDATERAYDVKFKDGSRHGTLTYFLLETFDELGAVGGHMHQLTESIRARIMAHRRNHQTRIQNPVLFGNKAQLFFGLAGPMSMCLGSIPITLTGHFIKLHAGAAHGISHGDQFILRPLSSQDANGLFMAEAIAVRGLTSDLRITGPGSNHGLEVESGWLARTTTRLSLKQFPIRLLINRERRSEWDKALKLQCPSLAECGGEACPSFTVTQTTEDTTTGYSIYDNKDQLITNIKPTSTQPSTTEKALRQLQHLATFALIRTISNLATDPGTLLFKSSFTATLLIINNTKTTSHPPGCAKSPQDPHRPCNHPECQIVLTPADKAKLVIRNLAAEPNGPRLFLHLYAMGSAWEVEDMTKSSREVLPPAGSGGEGHEHRASGVFQRTMRFSLEDGQEECEDVIKVFVTRGVTSFASLEMGKLGEQDGGDGKRVDEDGIRGAKGDVDGGEEVWAALTFRVRVVREVGSG
ncbi:hypothetical protein B0T16DRAFT_417487 [Cercophora newfieldiana]|uniref:Peptidase C14 caspase domain-containing protein n=1 Tax=Cercophora newfieldiana TaxID=92897 RepID=A0AA40CP95_9PEZI|nr:hypothetical protein B0T16DRAFT_417487 [Cercophora newfieldiana]